MKGSFKKIALIVSLGTFLSKIGGMLRQLVIAGAFGIGAAYDAYNYAYVIPGFFLILIGGINGPLHNAIVSVISKKDKKEGAYIISSIITLISLVFILFSLILFFGSDIIMNILAPGLNEEVHDIAVKQMQIMSPITLISGLLGISFGLLNANNEFFVPSISPIFSSFTLIIGVAAFWWLQDSPNDAIDFGLKGGVLLAKLTLIGALLQLIIQIPILIKKGLISIQIGWDFQHSGVKEVINILTPAIFASGMLQVNVITDLFFASGILGAAAGLGYANFLIQAPLGLFSSAILIPLLPKLSKIKINNEKQKLQDLITKGFMLCATSMIALAALYISLGSSIVDLVYARGSFDSKAINLVGNLLIVYGFGMPAYLCRDYLVRVFYAIGDGKTPFQFSSAGIILNIILDWLFVGGPSPWGNQLTLNFGAQGLILATIGVNLFTCLGLLLSLQKRIGCFPFKEWCINLLKVLICGSISGIFAWKLNSISLLNQEFLLKLLQVSYSGIFCITVFIISCKLLDIKEVDEIIAVFKKSN